MLALAEVVGESVALAVPDGEQMIYVDTAPSTGVVQVQDWTGRRFPFHTVAAGLALMTTWTRKELEVYGRGEFEQFTQATIADLSGLRSRMEVVRADGFAWTRAEFSEEVNGVAAPIRDGDGLAVGAINISGPIYRFPGSRPETEIIEELVSACRQISSRI
jgi:DNA-binding IclR family transcriptional regulator